MFITVIGAGAMGSLFGGLLKASGQDVVLVDLWQEHVQSIEHQGLTILDREMERNIKISARTEPQGIRPADLLLIFVKSTQTPLAARSAVSLLKPEGLVLSLQNGMGNGEALAEVVEAHRILAGTTSHGAHVLGPGRIRHAGQGDTVIGPWKTDQRTMDRATQVAELLTAAGIRTLTSEDILDKLWDKLLINVGINAITALTGITNGQILDLEDTKELARAAVEEAAGLAAGLGISLGPDPVQHVFEVARATAVNRSSMGQDVDKQRKTEIEAINGYIVREAEKAGRQVPVNRTLTALIQTLENAWQNA